MLPEFYISCFQSQLSRRACITLQILVFLRQFHKQVQIEKLAALFTMPIKFESRRRHIQRFLLLPRFQVKLIWFPIVKQILKRYFKNKRTVKVALDRTQWQDRNVFVISLIWDKRSLPLYWELLPKRGSSNLREQKALIRPVLSLLKGYKIILLGDREFGHVRLAAWLDKKRVGFALRTKADKYIRQEQPDLQTQLERAERFGHNFGNIPLFAPGTQSLPAPVIQPKLTQDLRKDARACHQLGKLESELREKNKQQETDDVSIRTTR